jgi:hypothetical protein
MKLIKHTPENHQSGKKNLIPSLSLNLSTGLISINRALAQVMGLKPGDQVILLQDETNKKDWYICKHKGFETRTSQTSKSIAFSSRSLVREVFKSLDWDEQSARIQAARDYTDQEGFRLFALITSGIKSTGRDKKSELNRFES